MSSKGKNIWFERTLLESLAYRSLKTPTAYFVFGIFMTKRQCVEVGRKGKEQWDIANNGKITFSYREAKTKHNISNSAFRDAIDELREKGLIDIAESGAGLYRSQNLYEISDRWRLYGTNEYRPPKPRQKGQPMSRGFQKGNRLGRNCKKKSNVTGQHSSTVTRQHSNTQEQQSRVDTAT
jgi:hypothetical protein